MKLLNIQNQNIIHQSQDKQQIHDNSEQYFPLEAVHVEYLQQPHRASWKQLFAYQKSIPAPEIESHKVMTNNKSPLSRAKTNNSIKKEQQEEV